MAAPHMNIPATVQLLAGALPRAQHTAIWNHCKIHFLDIPQRNPPHSLAAALTNQGIVTLGDMLGFSPQGIDGLTHRPHGNNDVPWPRGTCARTKIMISMYNDFSRQLNGNVDSTYCHPSRF